MRRAVLTILMACSIYLCGANIHGHLTRNTTWSASAGPYIIDGFLYIDSGATLTIEPGVTVLVKGSDGEINWNGFIWHGSNEPAAKMIIVKGRINAIGTAAAPIVFDAYEEESTWRWGGIFMDETAPESSFEYCHFRRTLKIQVTNSLYNYAALEFYNGLLHVQHCTFYDVMEALDTWNLRTDFVIYDCRFITEHLLSCNNYYVSCFVIDGSLADSDSTLVDYPTITLARCYFQGEMDVGLFGAGKEALMINNRYFDVSEPDYNGKADRLYFGSINMYGNYFENSELGFGCRPSNQPDSVFCRRNTIINSFNSAEVVCGSYGDDVTNNAFTSDNYAIGNIKLKIRNSDFYNNTVISSNYNVIDFGFHMPINARLYNNTFIGKNQSIYSYAIYSNTYLVELYNNTFYNFKNVLSDEENDFILSNNIFDKYNYLTSSHYFIDTTYPTFTANRLESLIPPVYSFVDGGGNICGDPLFADTLANDLSLQSGSPCIDAGQGYSWLPAYDSRYHHRVAGLAPDMGAYEYGSSYIGGIRGRVTDGATGQPVDCVKLSISGKLPEYTDTLGYFTADTGAGTYTIKASRWDYADTIIRDFPVGNGERRTIDIVLNSATSADDDTTPIATGDLSLCNYPNPFRADTNISFILPEKGDIRLDIYNIKGQKVRSMLGGNMSKGQHKVTWNGKDDQGRSVSSGIYFTRIEQAGKKQTGRMLLLK